MKLKLVFLFALISTISTAQTFDTELEKLCKRMGAKLNQHGTMEIAVYPFYNDNGTKSRAGRTIADDLWSYLVNEGVSYSVMDRSTMDEYLAEHNLNDEGLIDPSTAKQFGMLIAADAYVTGTVRVFPTFLKLNVKTVDSQTGKILATGMGRIPLDYETASYLGIENWRETKTVVEQNRSTNRRCVELKVGDYCIENTTQNLYEVTAIKSGGNYYTDKKYRLTLQPGETNCLRDLPEGSFNVRMTKRPSYVNTTNPKTTTYIEVCGAGRYVIR